MYDKHYQAWVNTTKKLHPAHDYLEKPAMVGLLKSIGKKYKKILLLGCGEGSEIRYIKDFFYTDYEIVGIDSSKELIEIAKYNFPQHTFKCMKLEDLDMLDVYDFDLVFSSLSLHYIDNWEKLFKDISKASSQTVDIAFSIQHPIKWGAKTLRSKEKNSFYLGYTKFKNKEKDYQIYGNYLQNHKIKDKLFGKIEIEYYNKSISEIFRIIKNSDFALQDFIEPAPIIESKEKLPDFYEVYSKIPLFAIFYITK